MVKHTLRSAVALSVSLFILATAHRASGQASAAVKSSSPKLVVLLVVDQLRVDYLTEYGGSFTSGLRRLMREGAWFKEGAYPYLNTVTCAGHSTIGTGTYRISTA